MKYNYQNQYTFDCECSCKHRCAKSYCDEQDYENDDGYYHKCPCQENSQDYEDYCKEDNNSRPNEQYCFDKHEHHKHNCHKRDYKDDCHKRDYKDGYDDCDCSKRDCHQVCFRFCIPPFPWRCR